MRIRFLRGTGLGGIGNDARPGDELDLPEFSARQFIAAGRAVAIAESPAPETAPAHEPEAPAPIRKKGK